MAEGALKLSRANVSVSTTGVAGPSSGDSNLEVGTVCLAWSFEREGAVTTWSETRKLKGDRNEIRRAGTDYAISRICHYHGEASAASAANAGAAVPG